MQLAHELLTFFNNGRIEGRVMRPLSLLNFIEAHPEVGSEIFKNTRYCKKLEQVGLLDHQGRSGDHPYYGHHYYTNKALFDNDISIYGGYDMLVEGFLSIRNRFKSIVCPISVLKANDDYSVGSAFIYDSETIITARHCMDGGNEGFKKINVIGENGATIKIEQVYFPSNPLIDVAILKTSRGALSMFPSYSIQPREEYRGIGEMDNLNYIGEESVVFFAPGKILDEVLTLGYPPIAGFEAILIADKAAINSKLLRTSEGQILAGERQYMNGQEYYLINAKVKGGNSGGPVLDNLGRVTGMIVAIPEDMDRTGEIDRLGYGLALPANTLKATLDGVRSNDGSVHNVQIHVFEDGTFRII